MKILKLLFLCLLISSCNAPRAVYDYDRQVNFNTYSPYLLYPGFHSGLNQLDERRLPSRLEAELKERRFSVSRMPDMYVNVYTEEYQDQNCNNIGIGGVGGNFGDGCFWGESFGCSRSI